MLLQVVNVVPVSVVNIKYSSNVEISKFERIGLTPSYSQVFFLS